MPVFNESAILNELHRRISKAVQDITSSYEIIYINDGSRDSTMAQLTEMGDKDNRLKYIGFSRNFGHQIAVTAGLDVCKGQSVVIIDGDLQDPPELIPEMYQKHKQGADVVYARRRKRKGDSAFKKITAKYFYRLLRWSTSVDIPIDTGDYRLIDRKVVEYLKRMPEQNKFLRGQIAWLGFKSDEVLFDRDARNHGKSGYPLSKMLKFAMDGITSFSDKPLQLVTRMGIVISFFSLCIMLYAVYSHYAMHDTITGWTSLIVSSMFIGGIQMISIGIIGEYVSRINRNVMNRPLYIVERTNIIQEADGC